VPSSFFFESAASQYLLQATASTEVAAVAAAPTAAGFDFAHPPPCDHSKVPGLAFGAAGLENYFESVASQYLQASDN
jgi:hypothetical protein